MYRNSTPIILAVSLSLVLLLGATAPASACVTTEAMCKAEAPHFQITNINLHASGEVAPGTPIKISFDWTGEQASSCPACIHQLYVGFAGEEGECLYSGLNPSSGSSNIALKAPATPGIYAITAFRTLQYECVAGQKMPTDPGISSFVAIVTVN